MVKLVPLLRLASKGLKLYNPQYSKTINLLRDTADEADKAVSETKASVTSKTFEPPEKPESSEASPSPGFEKTRDYTRKQTIKHLIAAEDHLKSEEEDVCRTCLGEKHLPALGQYAEEGKDYCTSECGGYSRLRDIVKMAEDELKGEFDADTREKLTKEFRKVRKELSPSKEVVEKVAEGLK